jgi:hypothetical protein
MNINTTLDMTPILSELFKTQATILAYVKVSMTDDQKERFNQEYIVSLKKVIGEFVESYPNQVSDKDSLLAAISS